MKQPTFMFHSNVAIDKIDAMIASAKRFSLHIYFFIFNMFAKAEEIDETICFCRWNEFCMWANHKRNNIELVCWSSIGHIFALWIRNLVFKCSHSNFPNPNVQWNTQDETVWGHFILQNVDLAWKLWGLDKHN